MWGLDKQELGDITYKGDSIAHNPTLWIRSDICRLQQLLDVPTTLAVENEKLKFKLNKKKQNQFKLEQQIVMQKKKINEMVRERMLYEDNHHKTVINLAIANALTASLKL
jgi:hypothetical protein